MISFMVLIVEQFCQADDSEIRSVQFKATLDAKEIPNSDQLLCIGPEILLVTVTDL